MLIGAASILAVIVATAFFSVRYEHNRMLVKVNEKNQIIENLIKAQQRKVNEITQTLTDKIDSVTGQRDAAIRRLRYRPERSTSQTAAANCKGATGSDLSRPDAEFLIGEAARADKQREALIACYHYADAIQE